MIPYFISLILVQVVEGSLVISFYNLRGNKNYDLNFNSKTNFI